MRCKTHWCINLILHWTAGRNLLLLRLKVCAASHTRHRPTKFHILAPSTETNSLLLATKVENKWSYSSTLPTHLHLLPRLRNVWSLVSLRHHGTVYGHIFTIHLAVTVKGGSIYWPWNESSIISYWLSPLWTGSDCTSTSAFSGCTNGHAIHTARLGRAFPRHHVSCPNRCLGMKKSLDKHYSPLTLRLPTIFKLIKTCNYQRKLQSVNFMSLCAVHLIMTKLQLTNAKDY